MDAGGDQAWCIALHSLAWPLTQTQAVASASVVVVARIRPKLPKENTEPDGGPPRRRAFLALRCVRMHVLIMAWKSAEVWRYIQTDRPWASPTGDIPNFARECNFVALEESCTSNALQPAILIG